MAITYNLAPIPKWVAMNNAGTVAGGAKLYTKRSLNKVQDKAVYQDAGGTIAWTNPILFDLNGVQGPFYWSVDSADLTDTYYLELYDADDNLLWTLDDYAPVGSGGGGNVTTYVPLRNYIANNQFINHVDDMSSADNVTNKLIAPSNHKGFTPVTSVPITGTYGVVGPDVRFLKNDTGLSSDQITFPLFSLASAPLTGDVTPVDYIRYQCTGSPAGETYKCFQLPITQKIKNLSNKVMTFTFWGAVTATPVTLTSYVRQYFGSGTATSAEVLFSIDTHDLTTTWTKFVSSFTVPDVAAKSIGTPGLQTDDDALYIQLWLPLGTNCDVLFTKPCLYLGDNINPDAEFDDYDQINSIVTSPRCADVRPSYSSFVPPGWVRMDDGSIGNAGSGATNRANADTFQLYKTLWDGVSDTYAPVSTGRGATAVADFLAGKTLTLPRMLGRAMAAYGSGSGLTARTLGEYLGSQTISISAMPAHNHPGSTVTTYLSDGSSAAPKGSNATASPQNASVSVASQGGGAADGNMPPISFMNVIIKL